MKKILKLILLFMAMVGIYIGIQFLSNQQWKIANERLKQYKNDLSEAQAKIDSLQTALKAKPNAENSEKPASNTTASTAPAHPKQAQLNKYIELCENATLPFDNIAGMQLFVEDLKADAAKPTGYDKLKDYADLYSRAYKVVCNIRNISYEGTTKLIAEGQPIAKDAAKYGNDLRPFRSGLGTLCIIHQDKEDEDKKYIQAIILEPDLIDLITDAKTFRDLIRIRHDWNGKRSN